MLWLSTGGDGKRGTHAELAGRRRRVCAVFVDCAARLEAEVRPLDAPSRSTMLSSGASDGQVTLEAHHASARKILLAVQQQLDLLETGRDTSIEIQSEISQRLNTLSREVQTIEELLPYAASDKRKVWGRRVFLW